MKNIVYILSIILISGICISCSTDDDSSNVSSEQAQISEFMQGNSFIISSFIDSGENETSDFTCYTFEFFADGIVAASNLNNTYSGNWGITQSTSDDDSSNDLDFYLNFNLTNDVEDLNDDWSVISYSSTTIELIDVSGGDGETVTLVFQVGSTSQECSTV
jgi:hypothetical protein